MPYVNVIELNTFEAGGNTQDRGGDSADNQATDLSRVQRGSVQGFRTSDGDRGERPNSPALDRLRAGVIV